MISLLKDKKLTMKKIILVLSLLLISIISVNTQTANYLQLSKTVPELTEANPQTASLGKYGNIPMNQYTGIANLSVPLYTLNFDGLSVPIDLSYNTTAIRPNQEATWVGLGWNLSSEPVITRKVNGLCDISIGSYAKTQTGFVYTDLALPNYGGTPPTNLYDKIKLYYAPYASVSGWDTEPDIFTLNVFGESVYFSLTQKALNNGVIGVKIINNDKRYKIEYIEKDQTFQVTNDQGFKFLFTVKETSVVAVNGGSDNFNVTPEFQNKIITGWKLSKIISPREKVLNFNYSLSTIVQSAKQSSQIRKTMVCAINTYDPNDWDGSGWSNNLYPTPSSFLTGYGVYYLESITSDNTTVEFQGSTRLDTQREGVNSIYTTNIGSYVGVENKTYPKKLDSVIIKNSLGEVTHNYKMTYSYFNNDKITEVKDNYLSNKVRLKLDQIDFNGEFYRKFTYINPNQLPDKTTLFNDFWGFQSSKQFPNGLFFPTYIKDVNWCGLKKEKLMILAGDRNPDFKVERNGLLETIIYPTKGYTKLTYEANNIKIDNNNIEKYEPYGLVKAKSIIVESQSLDYPALSDVFEIKDEAGAQLSLNITFGMGGMYDIPTGYDYGYSNIKFSIEEKDKNTIAYQVINVDTGKSVFEGNFTSSQSYDGAALKPDKNYNNWNKISQSLKLGKGKYQIKSIGFRHISNLFAENEEATNKHPDYMKIYKCSLKVETSLPIFTNVKTANMEVGGVRIKSIENYNSNNALLTKREYRYVLNEKNEDQEAISSGVLMDDLAFVSLRNHKFFIEDDNGRYVVSINTSKRLMEISNQNSLRSPSSYHIGYSRVEEIDTDNKQGLNNSGKKVSEFINKPNFYGYASSGGNFIMSPIGESYPVNQDEEYALVPFRSYQDINGKLKKEKYYDKNNNLIKKTDYEYDYNYYDMQNISHPKAIATGLLQYQKANYKGRIGAGNGGANYMEQDGSCIYAMQVYKIISEDISLLSKEDTEYNNGIAVSKKITYQYNTQFQPKKITENSSESTKNVETEILYPTDLVNVEQIPLLQQLVKDNIISEPVSRKTKVGTIQVSNSHIKYKEIPLSYRNKTQDLTKNIIVPDVKYERTTGDISLGSSDANNRTIKYDKYDSQGKLVQFTALEQAPVCYVWGYNGQYPIAKIENATYSQITSIITEASLKSISEKITPSATDMQTINGLRTNANLTDAMVTTYTYKPLVGVLTMTDPRGVTTYYNYDAFGRLKETYIIENGVKKVIQVNEYHYQNQ